MGANVRGRGRVFAAALALGMFGCDSGGSGSTPIAMDMDAMPPGQAEGGTSDPGPDDNPAAPDGGFDADAGTVTPGSPEGGAGDSGTTAEAGTPEAGSETPGAAGFCGDGTVDDGETCDDGGESETCDTDCTVRECGDGVVNATAGEQCDDIGESATCDADCSAAFCGDGTINATRAEECDDSGESATCDADCTARSCGDGITNLTAGEQCDAAGETADCDDDCTPARCGDGTINATAGETCDDAGESATCDLDCSARSCGDGVINLTAGEQCDDQMETADCDDDCTLAFCGDGTTNDARGETCDDAGESATCDSNCSLRECGDGTINPSAGEQCDDEGESTTCDDDCTVAYCGDGTTNETRGEQCDDGNDVEDDFCNDRCIEATCEDGTANGDETDVDCGGSCAALCTGGQGCNLDEECTTGRCHPGTGTCQPNRSCLSHLGDNPDAESGLYMIDPDGEGGDDPFEVYCDMETDGGGWQFVSAVDASTGGVIFGDVFCTDTTIAGNCRGRIHASQVSGGGQVLVVDDDNDQWVRYEGWSGDANSGLRYFSRELTLTASSDCGNADNTCGAVLDSDLRVGRTSGHQIVTGGQLLQWWRFGGWWIGANPGSGNTQGRLHATKYDTTNDLRARTDSNLDTVLVGDGDQRLFYRANTCADGEFNGNETGLDCGGICGDCPQGGACNHGGDCESGICDGGLCAAIAESCTQIFNADPSAPGGVYTIDSDGADPGGPFPVYCDMATDGGGWTLAFATKEFVARIDADPGAASQNFANESITDFINPPTIMEGHAVPSSANEVLWMCDQNGGLNSTRWWRGELPSQLVDETHTSGGHAFTTLAQSTNASQTPDFYVEGSSNFPTFRYLFLADGTTDSCGSASWGGNCYQSGCASSTGQCASSRMCDGVASTGASRFWLFWR